MTVPLALDLSGSLSDTWARIVEYMPTLLGGLGILAVGWLVAWVVARIVRVGLEKSGLDDRLAKFFDSDGSTGKGGTARIAAKCVYYTLLLFVLVAFFQQLGLTIVTEPISAFLTQVFDYAPRVIGAGVILVVAWAIATAVRFLVSGALGATQMDEALAARTGIGAGESKPMSGLLGDGLYCLILLLFLPAALGTLDIAAVSEPIGGLVDSVLGALPGIFAGSLVLVIAFFLGRVVRSLAASLLAGIGFDRMPQALGLAAPSKKAAAKKNRAPSQVAGMFIQITIMVFAAMQALPMVGFDQLSGILNEFVAFGGQVILGLVILCLGLYLSRLAADAILATESNNAPAMATVAKIAILVLTGAMALRRMGLADDIVNTAFSYSLGAVALAGAIAFGVGGRNVAGELLSNWTGTSNDRIKPAPRGGSGRKSASGQKKKTATA